MIKLLGPFLMMVGVFTFFIGQWIALEVYVLNKLSKVNQNTVLFLSELYRVSLSMDIYSTPQV